MLGEAAESFASTLWHSRRGQSRATFEAWQARRLAQWLRKAVPRVAVYSHAPEHLDDFPITDKATLMANFGAYNRPSISAAQAWDTLVAKDRLDMLRRPQRVAIILPRDTSLSESANQTRHLVLRFSVVAQGVSVWSDQLCTFNPTVIVAPPRILRHFTDTDLPVNPTRVFSTAETLDPVDTAIIKA